MAALGRCGTAASLDRLDGVARDPHEAPHVRDVARYAIAILAPERAGELARPLLAPAVAAAHATGDAAAVATAAERALGAGVDVARGTAMGLYLLDDAAARPAVFAMVRVARLDQRADASVIRALFRFADLRRDGELFALVARRIDDQRGERRPFGPRTRQYLRRYVARMLRRLGRAGSPHYVAMASAVLCSYRDADAEPARTNTYGPSFDRFARFHALNDICYGRSARYVCGPSQRSVWRCADGHRPGGPAPAEREERFPALWDAAPAALWGLIVRARATPALELATRALRANPAFVAALSDEALADALAGGHVLGQHFAYEAAKTRPLSAALARGALASEIAEAQVWVLLWVASNPSRAAADAEMVALLVTGHTPAVRDAALALLEGRTLAAGVARSAAARAVAILLGLDATAEARATGAVGVILRVLAEPLRDVGEAVLRDLIRHPLGALGVLAGELMLRHVHRDRLPHDLLEGLLASPHAPVRALAGRLIALTPPDVAKDDLDVLELFATSANAELRDGTRPLLAAIARDYPDVGRALAERLVAALLKKQAEGVPAHIVALLRGELARVLPVVPAAQVTRLASALSPHAREAAGLLLATVDPDDLDLQDVARLASNEILAVRRGAWSLARRAADRYAIAPAALARLVDSSWEDTRAFATAFIRELGDAVTADAVIAICDSVRPEVQAFGKALLLARFTEADAGKYLVRLAEHPSTNLQLLVSGLLEHHVGGDLVRLEAVAPFLVTVLSQVNRGGVAKQRVLALLRREATRSPEHARLIAPILDRQSATIAITQKHPLIATMVAVGEAYPDVPLPIAIVPPVPLAAADNRDDKGGL
ncbi:MAG: hypothetical protein KF773_35765 [Deltaproteobacteria bacterium]|nr:hypothetical protein [Deltaproteobacteria bacterium]